LGGVLKIVQVYPGLAASLLGGADANTQQVSAWRSQLPSLLICNRTRRHLSHSRAACAAGAAAAAAQGLCAHGCRRLAIDRCCSVMLHEWLPTSIDAM